MRVVQLRAPVPPELEQQLIEQGRDYVKRSGEEIYPEEEDLLLTAALTGINPTLRLVGALDDSGNLVGWALVQWTQSTVAIGPELVVWQLYMVPGRARLRDVVSAGMEEILAIAREWGCARITAHIRRFSGAYLRILRGLGFDVHSVTMVRRVGDGGTQSH